MEQVYELMMSKEELTKAYRTEFEPEMMMYNFGGEGV